MLQLAAKLKQARLSAELNITEAADAISTKRSTYQYWEEKGPPLDKIPDIIKAFKLPDNYFFVNDPAEYAKIPMPIGDLKITLKDHFDLLKEKDRIRENHEATLKEYTSIMKRIIEAKLLEPESSPVKEADLSTNQKILDEKAAEGMIGRSAIVDKSGGNYRVKKKKT